MSKLNYWLGVSKKKKVHLSPDKIWVEENGPAEETEEWPERNEESLKNVVLQKEVFHGKEGGIHSVECCQGNKSEEG